MFFFSRLRRRQRRITALVGTDRDCAAVLVHLHRRRHPPIARFEADPHALSLLADAVRAGTVTSVVVVDPDPAAAATLRAVLGDFDLDVVQLASPFGGSAARPFGAAPPTRAAFGVLPARALAGRPIGPVGRAAKSTLDRALAGLLLLLAALPMLAAAALLARRGRPVLRRVRCHGRNGRPFTLLRFDARAPGRVGTLLRHGRLDALPQLFNVLRGEMSLVGPPPHAPGLRVAGEAPGVLAPDYPRRHRVKPGLTGLAQLRAGRGRLGSAADLRERLRHDLAYVATWSLPLDLKLLGQTPWRVVRGR